MEPDSRPDDLEDALRDARALLEQATFRDAMPAVRARMSAEGAKPSRTSRRWRGGLVLAFALLAAGAGVTAAAVLGLQHLVIVRTGSPSPSGTLPIGGNLYLGRVLSLEEAATLTGRQIRYPASLGAPDRVQLMQTGSSAIVSLTYGPRSALPAPPAGRASALLMEIAGRLDEADIRKEVAAGGVVEPVQVGKVRGFWIAGTYHNFIFSDASGGPTIDEPVTANTLIWEDNGVVYRLESLAGRSVVIALASEVQG
jgi:hypothetical protein